MTTEACQQASPRTGPTMQTLRQVKSSRRSNQTTGSKDGQKTRGKTGASIGGQ